MPFGVLRRGIIGGVGCSGGWSSVERRVAVGMEDGEGAGVGIGEVGRVEGLVDEIVGVGVNDGVGRWKKGLDGPEVKAVGGREHTRSSRDSLAS